MLAWEFAGQTAGGCNGIQRSDVASLGDCESWANVSSMIFDNCDYLYMSTRLFRDAPMLQQQSGDVCGSNGSAEASLVVFCQKNLPLISALTADTQLALRRQNRTHANQKKHAGSEPQRASLTQPMMLSHVRIKVGDGCNLDSKRLQMTSNEA